MNDNLMPTPLVTVTAYPAPSDARVAKGALDEAGIESVVEEHVARAKVRVQNVDALRAGDILTAQLPTLPEIDEADEDAADLECPACGSRDVARAPRALTFALIAVTVLGIGIGTNLIDAAFFAVAASGLYLLVRGRWRCGICDERWN